ncbi:MAG: transporter substrate-binding domain-containing protein [Pseudomonas sp.]|uniref:transporter substrate-binding domain-containing protein n=1 Tax=Pseudomonas sp. TaxID=306 RepID=UPI00264A24EB|nr:transporter substrate-binding domain-containing protein [Pseudomonas sp.]MDN5391067.1 transporter substrate-binding domain-containing protein [Pseudomonas sp.]MDN5393029.1 transporter substrate-binding domain-containing protein [Pseudomonas sp.]MDN5405401.1 transporter substrate-binding domain-containing protein [Pseudomonas sp.]MDN5452898.1 transporter substrate-binding domain-containing protein [Pseudomonas sp.]MDN5456981.1 transporter substrate-binding domain-containing protein [Pseudomo
MPARLIKYLSLFAGLVLCVPVLAAPVRSETLTLLSRSSSGHIEVPLDNTQRYWLQNKRELVIGTSAADYPPFDMTDSGRDYEGLTADYAGLLRKALKLSIRIQRFASREAAIKALEDGQIDLLGTSNGFEAANQHLVLSIPYAIDQPVLVTREGETRSLSQGLAGLRLSMVYHYLPQEEVKALYPQAIIQSYPSYQNAINAVAFDQADIFLGDTVSTHYMINKGYLKNIKMANFGKHEAHGFSFAVRRDNSPLLGIINATLKAVPNSEQESIAKRWSAGSDILLSDQKLQLTQREARWLLKHPVVNVVVNETMAPLTFFDASGDFRGITADLLEMIRLRTGLRFEIQRANSLDTMTRMISRHETDIISAINPSASRESALSFTRPYLVNSFVLLTAKGDGQPASLEQLAGKKLALTRGNPLTDYLRSQYPQITLVETGYIYRATELLAEEKVQGAVSTLVIANYLLASGLFQDRLQISATIGTQPAMFSLATARDASELSSILNKALLSIAPDELGIINSRWRGYVPASDSYWHNYHRLFYQFIIGTSLLLLLSLIWNAYMRRQIRQRKSAERALSDQFEFMRALVNGTPHPIYVRDREGVLKTCNDSYLNAFSARREEVIGKTVMQTCDLLSNECEARDYQADYLRVMREGTPLVTDRPLRIGEKTLTIYHWILPYRDSLGEVQGIIGGWIDISERHQLLDELRTAKELADDANRAKSTFLATMSHEIRTPMNAVIGLLELTLKRADHGHLDRPSIEVAYNSAKDLLELIGDILDIARIESGRLNLSPERVNLHQLAHSVMRIFDGLARQKNLTLDLRFDATDDLPDVLIDPLRLKQILTNLISNAIKFTQQGRVTLEINLLPAGTPERTELHLSVKDTGIGISERDQARLFEPFAQAQNSGQLALNGAGLGLVICRSLCEMMGGTLVLSSQESAGTQVQIKLKVPTLTPSQCTPAQEPSINPAAHPLNVLVVDDHPANRLLMCQQLGFLGHRFTTEHDGAAGLKTWKTGKFDLVIADCNMPVLNGYELTRAIRKHELASSQRPCTVLGFTANAQPEERQRCKQAGMDDCLFKPISLTLLSQRLAMLEPLFHCPEVFNADALSPLTGGDKERTRLLLEELLRSNCQDLKTLLELPDNGELQAFVEIAHRIKGAARIVGAQSLINNCEALEQATPANLVQAREQVQVSMRALGQALALQLESLTKHT